MSFKDKSTLDKAGQYTLDRLEIISYQQEKEESAPRFINLEGITANFEIAEDIYSSNMVGSITVYDSQDIKSLLPITGLEKLAFRYSTPGFSGYDCSESSGQPMQIYKIDKVKLEPQTGKQQLYRIFFCSPEMYNNSITRVSKAFSGPVEEAIDQILRARIYLNSKKPIFVEPTKTNTKVVIPNVRPYTAIKMLAEKATSAKYNSSGYNFYETSRGFNFRSLESMLAMSGSVNRPPQAIYRTQIGQIRNPDTSKIAGEVERAMTEVIDYRFEKPVDTMSNIQVGMYANRLVVHDAFNKTLTTTDYNYKEDFAKSFHVDKDGGMLLPDTPWSDSGKALYEHPMAKLMTVASSSKIHNDYESTPSTNKQQMVNNMAVVRNMNLSLKVHGNTHICAGDVIEFKSYMVSPTDGGQTPELNPFQSGNYVVLAVKHIVSPVAQTSETIIRCYKDSVGTPYPDEPEALIVGKEDTSKGDIYEGDLLAQV